MRGLPLSLYSPLILLIFVVTLAAYCIVAMTNKSKQLKRYRDVTIGMSEEEMIEIMGDEDSLSSLKNNRKKYEWRINASSYSSHGFRAYSGVMKVDIYTKDGVVEEIRPFNI